MQGPLWPLYFVVWVLSDAVSDCVCQVHSGLWQLWVCSSPACTQVGNVRLREKQDCRQKWNKYTCNNWRYGISNIAYMVVWHFWDFETLYSILIKTWASHFEGKQYDGYSPRPRDQGAFNMDEPQNLLQDPESLIVAMERVTVLFDRWGNSCYPLSTQLWLNPSNEYV